MTAAMAWVGACLYMSVLDRTPRAPYLFMLAGYTAAMIGFPSSPSPRWCRHRAGPRREIALGIVCATLVHGVVLPRGAPALTLLLDKAVRDARLWMQDILAGGDAGKSDKDRRTLANDITQLRLLCRPTCPSTPATCAGPPARCAPCRTASRR